MRFHAMKAAVVGIALVAVLAACGSSDKKTTPAATTPPTTAAPATTTTAAPANPYKAEATPTDGLKEGDQVTVTVSGFKPKLVLGINECAQTGPDGEVGEKDCDLGGIKTITVGADGTGTGKSTVKSKGIGANAHDCSKADERCFLSVGELSADPKAQRADDVDLHFAG
jgi:major membrane immunogen (membrane-anchored lipoprotein)